MSDFLPFAFLLGLTQLALCAALATKSRKWARRHPSGGDPQTEFNALQVATSVIGLTLAATLLYLIKLPSWDALLKGNLDAWQVFDLDLLACLSVVPAMGLIRRLRRRAKIVSLLAGVAILPSLGTVVLTAYATFITAS